MNESEAVQFVKETDWSFWVQNETVRNLLSQIRTTIVESTRTEGDGASSSANPSGGPKPPAPADDSKVKLVVVGDGAVGKTCLLVVFSTGKFPEEYTPTVFENFTTPTKFGDRELHLHLWDTAGQEEYDRLRPLSYPGTDVVLLCYSTVFQNTFQAISTKWAPEIRHYLPNVPTILVGLKTDLRDRGIKDPHAPSFEPISAAQGDDLAKKIGAVRYLEASARENRGVKEIFDAAVATTMQMRHPGGLGASQSSAALVGAVPGSPAGAAGASSSAAAANNGGTAGAKPRKKSGCMML